MLSLAMHPTISSICAALAGSSQLDDIALRGKHLGYRSPWHGRRWRARRALIQQTASSSSCLMMARSWTVGTIVSEVVVGWTRG
jgi:hypothetical protein